jgi:hypothetical protein
VRQIRNRPTRPKERRKRKGSREAECIPSKARSDATVQSEVKATESDETDKYKEKEREQRRLMDTVGKRL